MDSHIDPATGFLGPGCPLPLDRPFTHAEAVRLGVRANTLTRWCRTGTLRRVLRGVYAAAQLGDSVWVRARSLALVVPADAVVCDGHAGWLLGADMALAPGEHLEARPISLHRPSGHGRVRSGIADGGERNLVPNDLTEIHGVRVTTPLRTAFDLGRVRHPDRAIAGMDAMAALGGFTASELVAGVERFRGMRWVTTLRTIAPLVDGRAESPPESILRLRWIQAGLPTPQPQVKIWEGGVEVARLDVGNGELRFAAEYDGEEFHTSPAQVEHDLRRRAGLGVRHDWVVAVVRRDNLFGPHQDVDVLLRQGLEVARRRAGSRLDLPIRGEEVPTRGLYRVK